MTGTVNNKTTYDKEEITIGIQYFIIHFCIELLCFYCINRVMNLDIIKSILVCILYDFIAFLPQGLIGNWYNKHKGFKISYIGLILMILGTILMLMYNTVTIITGITVIALGNAILHECGAIGTITVSKGNIFPSALFVGGGSFGLIVGKTLSNNQVTPLCLIPFISIMILLTLISDKTWINYKCDTYNKIKATNIKVSSNIVIIVAFIVVIVRSFIGYGIPTSWRQTTWQFFIMYFAMGFGKAFGGYLCDKIGYKTTGIISTLVSIPFLIIGDRNMMISVLGIMMFSMTMSVTFGMLLDRIQNNPGLAFGITTIGLIVGTIPIFIWKFTNKVNTILVIIGSLLSFGLLSIILCNKNIEKEE